MGWEPRIISMSEALRGRAQRRPLGRRGIQSHRLFAAPPAPGPARRLAPILILLVLALLPWPAQSGERLPQPKGPVLLAVSGDIDWTTDGREALFDRQMLESLGVVTLTAVSPLDETPVEFQGVLLRRLLAAVGAHGDAVEAIALNDYVAEIPFAEVERHDVVIALSRQGRAIPVREMGPLMILYPIGLEPGLNTEAIAARSVRQLARLVIRDSRSPLGGSSLASSADPSNDGTGAQP
ncbi:hypothetical protein FRZ61_48410 [Hypericibacter adhaerens]|jgi:hypothetical protein|uniref:Oxidoreductase molybdopterin-binding domain-containing protein n=2 Tax=Hypericibacter adhaerens TaxID=2602016 RepID=A0A5J6N4X7_9PROT|nr:hypothetical protein FRZ61_48410 [Hypericibacter adhaerens]